MLELKHVSKSFGTINVLNSLDFLVEDGQMCSIVGKSGSGKSTMLQIAGTLEPADAGEVFINGTRIQSLSEKALARLRNEQLGFIFQFHYLLPEFTALENVLLPCSFKQEPSKEEVKRAHDLLELLELKDRKVHKPEAMSGGEQQRVAIARALIKQPSIILADEPTGNLDSQTSQEIHKLFLMLNKERGQTFVIVTHNPSLANLCPLQYEIMDGKISRL